MSRHILMAVLVGLATNLQPLAAEEKDEKADGLPALVNKLHTLKVTYEGDINNVSLFDLLQTLSRKYDITFIINEEGFRTDNDDQMIREHKPMLTATRLDGLTLRGFLDIVLGSMKATYLVRKDYLEVVSIAAATREAKLPGDSIEHSRLAVPLVSAVVQEQPLNETLANLANWYDASIVLAPQAGAAASAEISARLMNVPLDKALELLALQADLVVVPRGNAYLVTTAAHAKQLARILQSP